MEIQILGAHQFESKGARLTSLLIDGTLVIDAGGLTSALSVPEQKKIKTVLFTHHHFDHTRDLVTLAANAAYYWRGQLVAYALRYTLDIVTNCLLDGRIYTNFGGLWNWSDIGIYSIGNHFIDYQQEYICFFFWA